MAELSQDTQAIIQRLKDEGQLVRNSGTNSIRSVKIQLEKFESVFQTISNNSLAQTELLKKQAGIEEAQAEKQAAQEQLDELKKEQENKSTEEDNRKKTDEKIDEMADSIKNALSFRSALNAFKDLALVGGGLFVGYNLIKGFINDRTNGGFDRMEESIANMDFSSLGTLPATLANLNTTISSMNTSLSELTTALSELEPAARRILDSITEIVDAYFWKSILVAGAGLATALINARTRIGTLPRIPPGLPPGAPGVGGGRSFLGRLGSFLRPALRAGGAIWTVSTLMELDAENQAAFEEGGTEAVQALLEERQNNMMDAFESTPVLSQLIDGYNALYEMVHGEPPARTQAEQDRRNAERAALAAEEALMNAPVTIDAQAAENARIAGLSDADYQRESLMEEADYLRGEIANFNAMHVGGGDSPLSGPLQARLNEIEAQLGIVTERAVEAIETVVSSGRGTIIESPTERAEYIRMREGELLDALIEVERERQDTMSALQSYLDAIEQGAVAGGATVVISAPTTVSPVVNNVSGGRSVNQVSVRGGGGGTPGIRSNPYGIPGFAN